MPSHPVDVFVGRKLRERRTLLGLSQDGLGEAVGVTFQQIQKYEKGYNRIGSSRLYEFAKILDTDVSYFFEGMDGVESEDAMTKDGEASVLRETSPLFEHENVGNKEVLTLVRAYNNIADILVRKRVLALVKAISATSGGGISIEEDENEIQFTHDFAEDNAFLSVES